MLAVVCPTECRKIIMETICHGVSPSQVKKRWLCRFMPLVSVSEGEKKKMKG